MCVLLTFLLIHPASHPRCGLFAISIIRAHDARSGIHLLLPRKKHALNTSNCNRATEREQTAADTGNSEQQAKDNALRSLMAAGCDARLRLRVC